MDRQDIDALLIGALYGELTPADEARLAAHLESHPTDRGALDDLKNARQVVRESRIFELQLDPPQAVSALLLQEAHRRAPKRVVAKEQNEGGWFYRFTRTFLAHPAMAAAAMLVLVVGVAGTLYMQKGAGQFADKEMAAPAAPSEVAATAPSLQQNAGSAQGEAAPAEAAYEAASSGYQVGLDDAKDGAKLDTTASTRNDAEPAKLEKQQQGLTRGRDEAKNKKSATMVVDIPQRQPKELPEPRAKGAKPADEARELNRFSSGDSVVGGVGSTSIASGGAGGAPSGRAVTAPRGTSGTSRNMPAAPPPPPPASAAPAPAPNAVAQTKAPAPAKPTTTATATPKQSVTKEAEKGEAPQADPSPAKDTTLLAWAKGEHSRTVALANKGDCTAAAKAAVGVMNRAPDYYTQFMATDRALKKCQAYIASERDVDAERSGKARAQKRVNADEPASSR